LSEERTDSCIIIELILIIIDNIMTNKILKLVFLLLVFLTSACVKETYNMDKLSTKAHLTPTMALAAIRGDISFSDMVKSVDSVVIDQGKFVKLIFQERLDHRCETGGFL
jgi:hypothetical protein